MSMKVFEQKQAALAAGELWDDSKPVKPGVDCSGDVLITKQADRDEADINKIIARFEKTGMVLSLNQNEPFYGDVSEFNGLADAYIKIREAEELFMNMSAEIRNRFDNDPVKMIEFLADEKNREEAEKLGMVVKRPVEPPTPPAPSDKGVGA